MATTIELPNKAYMLPDSIPNWPPVWWFWLVLVVAALTLLLVFIGLRKRHLKRAYRREALAQLKQHPDLSDQALTELCLTLIKRCLITEGKDTLASLTTPMLLPLLDQQLRFSRVKLTDFEDSFSSSIYRPNSQLSRAQRDGLIRATRHWIRRHRA